MTASDIYQIISTVAIVQCICDVVCHYYIYSTSSYQQLLHQLQSCSIKLRAAQNKLSSLQEVDTTTTTTTTTTKATTTKDGQQRRGKKQPTSSSTEKQQKVIQQYDEEYKNILAMIASKHMIPNVTTAVIFLVLLRILGMNHQGHIIAILPFIPHVLLQKITLRGIQSILSNHHNNNMIDPSSSSSFIIEQLLYTNHNITQKSRTASGIINSINDIGQLATFTCIYMLTAMSVKYYVHQCFTTKPPQGAESYLSSIAETKHGQSIIKQTIGVDINELKKME